MQLAEEPSDPVPIQQQSPIADFGLFSVDTVEPTGTCPEEVINLWKRDRRTLGLMPRGAFDQAVAEGCILAARDGTGAIVGYLLFRLARDAAWIVHLCVDRKARTKGVSAALVSELRRRMFRRRGIGLSCRNDFSASKVWRRLGFIPISERTGKAGKLLTNWWMDFGSDTLFSNILQRVSSDWILVAIDANVFFDLYDDTRPTSQESQVLLEDWLGNVRLVVTDEIYADIGQGPDAATRTQWRTRAATHNPLVCSADSIDLLLPQVERVVFLARNDRDRSDIRHLVRCVATGTRYFITRDSRILSKAAEIQTEFGVHVCRPIDFALFIDRRERGDAYRPIDLDGTQLRIRRLDERDCADLPALFQNSRAGERQGVFLERVHANTQVRGPGNAQLIADSDNESVALWTQTPNGDQTTVQLLRVRPCSAHHTIARHVVRHLLRQFHQAAASLVVVTDPALQDSVIEALIEEGFCQSSQGWIRALVPGRWSMSEVSDKLTELAVRFPASSSPLEASARALAAGGRDLSRLLETEQALWPVRLAELGLPCFIIPIQPRWAQHLFDSELARGTLYGADPTLMLRREAVYYRSKRLAGLKAPARALWYVSKGPRGDGPMAISAVSYIDDLVVGSAKELYGRFRRLGVYQWKDVLEAASGDPKGEIMAVRFSGVESLRRRVAWREFQPVLQSHGVNTTLVAPTRIDPDTFEELLVAAQEMPHE